MKTRYARIPHPLSRVPPAVLATARAVLAQAVEWRDVDPDQAYPIADAVVAELAAAGMLRDVEPSPTPAELGARLDAALGPAVPWPPQAEQSEKTGP